MLNQEGSGRVPVHTYPQEGKDETKNGSPALRKGSGKGISAGLSACSSRRGGTRANERSHLQEDKMQALSGLACGGQCSTTGRRWGRTTGVSVGCP